MVRFGAVRVTFLSGGCTFVGIDRIIGKRSGGLRGRSACMKAKSAEVASAVELWPLTQLVVYITR